MTYNDNILIGIRNRNKLVFRVISHTSPPVESPQKEGLKLKHAVREKFRALHLTDLKAQQCATAGTTITTQPAIFSKQKSGNVNPSCSRSAIGEHVVLERDAEL